MMAKNRMKSMMQGAFALTIASFVAKLLSAIYRVPFQNLVGDEGFYVYQQVYPIYGLAMTLALAGLPQFISKIIAEAKNPKKQQMILEELYSLVFWLSVLLWSVFFFFGKWIALIMGNVALKPLIQMVSFAFLLIPSLSFYRGNFQGKLQMIPSAISQVVEQFLRVGVILFGAAMFHQWTLSIYQVGTIAMAGSLVGGIVAIGILAYYDQKIYGLKQRFFQMSKKITASPAICRRFLVEGGLLSIFSGLLIMFQFIDSFLIVNSLELSGMAEQSARVAKGIYDRGQPLVQLGLVVAAALGSTFLPALTGYLVEKREQLFTQSAKIYLKLTVGLGLAATSGLAVLLPSINFALFKDNQGSATLTLFVFAIVLTAAIQAYQSISQSQNHFRRSLKAAGWGLGVKLLTTGVFTYFWGTVGASLSTLVGLITIFIYFVRKEESEVNAFWRENHFGIKLIGVTLGMVLILLGYFQLIHLFFNQLTRVQTLLTSVVGVIVGGGAFIQLAVWCRLLTIREWLLLPFGKKILHFNGGK